MEKKSAKELLEQVRQAKKKNTHKNFDKIVKILPNAGG